MPDLFPETVSCLRLSLQRFFSHTPLDGKIFSLKVFVNILCVLNSASCSVSQRLSLLFITVASAQHNCVALSKHSINLLSEGICLAFSCFSTTCYSLPCYSLIAEIRGSLNKLQRG